MKKMLFSLCLLIGITQSAHAEAIKVLLITGDNITVHDWKAAAASIKEILAAPAGKFQLDVSTTPAKDLNDENLAKTLRMRLFNDFNLLLQQVTRMVGDRGHDQLGVLGNECGIFGAFF